MGRLTKVEVWMHRCVSANASAGARQRDTFYRQSKTNGRRAFSAKRQVDQWSIGTGVSGHNIQLTSVFPDAATLQKLVKDFMPGDIRVAGEAVDMMVACCTGEMHGHMGHGQMVWEVHVRQ